MGCRQLLMITVFLISVTTVLEGQIEDNSIAYDSTKVYQRGYIETYDGSTIHGLVINDNKRTVIMKIIGENIVSIDHGDIEHIKLEGKHMSFTHDGRYNINRGLFFKLMPLSLGFSSELDPSYSGQLAIGYQLNERLGFGLGSGFDVHSDRISGNWYDIIAIPFYGHVRYNINLKGPRAYLLGQLGAARQVGGWWNDNTFSLPFYNQLGVGVAFPSKHLGRFVMEISRAHILVNGTLFDWRDSTLRQDFTKLLGRTTFRIGYSLGM